MMLNLHWFLSTQLGLDPSRFLRFLGGLPLYLREWRQFRRGYTGRLSLVPCLHERFEQGGTTKSEYFWQDLLVARWIYEANPERHVDVGSRVDGFVAHVASFREIEVFDVRPMGATISGVLFRQADLMAAESVQAYAAQGGYCDSLSCLHAIEHFGLGRYGDPIHSKGYEQGIANMVTLLKPSGTFYLSTPIGRERVQFNANWIFDPRTILGITDACGLQLRKLVVVTGTDRPQDTLLSESVLAALAERHYALGVFVFKKVTTTK